MACKRDSKDYELVKKAVLTQLAPLKLNPLEAEKLAENTISFFSSDAQGGLGRGTNVDFSKSKHLIIDTDLVVPKLEISPTSRTAWVRNDDGSRFFVTKKKLDFLPVTEHTNFTNWAMNTLFGDKENIVNEAALKNFNTKDGYNVLVDTFETMLEDPNISDEDVDTIEDILSDPQNIKDLVDVALTNAQKYGLKISQEEFFESPLLSEDQEQHDGISGGFMDKATTDPLARVSEKLKLELARIPKISSTGEIKTSKTLSAKLIKP